MYYHSYNGLGLRTQLPLDPFTATVLTTPYYSCYSQPYKTYLATLGISICNPCFMGIVCCLDMNT